MKKLIILDAFGTVISTANGSVEACEKILARQPEKIDAVKFYARWKKWHRKHLDEANSGEFLTEHDIYFDDLRELYAEYKIDRPFAEDVEIMLASLEGRKVFPEVIEAVNKLRERYRVVIGSTSDNGPLLRNMAENGFEVDAVYTSELMRKYKPVPEFYSYILEHEGVDAEDAVFVGDSIGDDVGGPQKYGMTGVLINRKKSYDPDCGIIPDHIIDTLDELLSIEF